MINGKKLSCCFTGHRKIPPEDLGEISRRLEASIVRLIEDGCTRFYSGGALGFDTLAAQLVLKLRLEHPEISLVLVLPCLNQAEHWSAQSKAVYAELLNCADEVVYTAQSYFRGCMHKRNRYLVDHSELCICYLAKSSGGTAYTVDYARKKQLTVYNVAQG